MGVAISRHAAGRRKERGISQEAIDLLLRFGTYRPNGRGGATVGAMTAAGRAVARRDLGRDYGRLMRRFDIVVIVVDGVVATVYWRCRRLRLNCRNRT